ncbi:hypothetical protein [Acidovorax soli]|nr:hypothetical protein [Acidovorax soli]
MATCQFDSFFLFYIHGKAQRLQGYPAFHRLAKGIAQAFPMEA